MSSHPLSHLGPGVLRLRSYWNETFDAGRFSTSDILDPDFGFGGNGVAPEDCIADGPFANYTNRFGPWYSVYDHCIYRNISDWVSLGARKTNIDGCLEKADFLSVWPCLEGAPHAAGHGGIGGLVSTSQTHPLPPAANCLEDSRPWTRRKLTNCVADDGRRRQPR